LELQLWSSTDLSCASQTDILAYAQADCATISRVTAQLAVDRSQINPTSNRSRLDLYIYDRQSSQPSLADRVDAFVGP
jgi:hypothetical protein